MPQGQQEQINQDRYLRQLIRQELARLAAGAGGQPAGGIGSPGDGQMAQGQPSLQSMPMPAAAPFQPAAGAVGAPMAQGGAMPATALQTAPRMAAGTVAGAFLDTHAQLSQAMASALQKLRAVLQETEEIARRMEEVLSQQASLDPGQSQGQDQQQNQRQGRQQGQGARQPQGKQGQDRGQGAGLFRLSGLQRGSQRRGQR